MKQNHKKICNPKEGRKGVTEVQRTDETNRKQPVR